MGRNQGGNQGQSDQKQDDNRSDQLNPNNDAYWQSRGEEERPDDWEGGAQSGRDGRTVIHAGQDSFPGRGSLSFHRDRIRSHNAA